MSEGKVRLSLSIQYGATAAELPRWRLRGWAESALNAGAATLEEPPQAAELTLRLVDADEGRALNHGYRERDYATNVLTFEYGIDPQGTLHGDIVLCLPVLQREAAEQGKPLRQHAAHLVVHGVLHALGYDHLDEEEAAQMEALETRILARLRVPDPYRERDIE
ncbi:rRNA maturation RNase YbeY [Verticiella sediminum]|uniref:Endoribonuclease YbeY n=1 Tax=Verticiella sediminum TaxID=1247510 RepID=A0A556ACD4_9BURK|nr:rRNA maturation RNase YbeY [Verticiella sediminum]TSH90537.1 rRNA maturation RNase YbeY [Verticiella sediminum]